MPSTVKIKFRIVAAGRIIALSLVLASCGAASQSTTTVDVEALVRYVGVLEEANAELQRQLDQATRPDGSAAGSTSTSITSTSSSTSSSLILSEVLKGEVSVLRNASSSIGEDVSVLLDDDRQVCTGRNGLDDLRQGAAVVISDETGQIVATAQLGEGRFDEISYTSGINWATGTCTWAFETEVPGDRSFYTVEVTHRGGVTYSREDLVSSVWSVSLSI